MFRKWVSHILIASFVFLAIPKQLWHDCDHTDDDHHHETETKFEKKCFTCDFQLAPALNPTELALSVIPQDYYIAQEPAIDLVDISIVNRDCLRGPPTI